MGEHTSLQYLGQELGYLTLRCLVEFLLGVDTQQLYWLVRPGTVTAGGAAHVVARWELIRLTRLVSARPP